MEEEKIERKKGHSIWLCVGVGVLSAFVTSWCIGSVFKQQMDEFLTKIKTSDKIVVNDNANSGFKLNVQSDQIEGLKKQAENSLKLAQDNKKNNTLRSMYYVNSITSYPNNEAAIKEYVEFMVTSVDKGTDDDKIKMYQSLLTFLGNLSVKVHPDVIVTLDKLSSDLKVKIDEKIKLTAGEVSLDDGNSMENIVDYVAKANEEWKNLTKDVKEEKFDSYDTYVEKISNFLSVYENLKSDSKFNVTYLSAQKLLERFVTGKQIMDFAKYMKGMIEIIQQDSNVDHALIAAGTMENSLNSLVANKYRAPGCLANKFEEMERDMANLGDSLRTKISTPILEKVKNDCDSIETEIHRYDYTPNGECENVVQKLKNLTEYVQESKLDLKNKNQVIANLTKKIAQVRNVQTKKYNGWALRNIDFAYENIKQGIDETPDNVDRIKRGLTSLGNIDVYSLSNSVHNAYQTVFQCGYSELSNDDKLIVDRYMDGCTKTKLGDF